MELKIIPVAQVIIAILLMMLISSNLSVLNYHLGITVPTVTFLILIAIIIAFLAISDFRKHQTTVNPTKPETARKVVNTGIYAFSRNPMYLAMLVLIIAIAISLQNIAVFVVIPIFIIYITKFQIIPEERALTQLFGIQYESYKQKVRRWV